MKRAVIYTRVSTTEQGATGTSLASQFAACHEKAAFLGMTVIGSYEDIHTGADYAEREGLQKALERLEGEADALIIYDISRYSRDLAHQQLIKKRVLKSGKQLIFCTSEIGDLKSPESHLSFGVTGIFAEYERLKIRERSMMGSRTRAKQGIQPSRAMRPYGYEIVTKPLVMQGKYKQEQIGTYVILELEAKWIKTIYKKYLDGGSLKSVAQYLTDRKVPTMRGAVRWYSGVIKTIITNPVYKGEALYGRHQRMTDETRLERGLRKAYKKTLPESQWTRIPVPAIVDTITWERAVKRVAEGRELRSGNPDRKYLLSGLLRCPVCGFSMGGKSMAGSDYKNIIKRRAEGKPRPTDTVYQCRRAMNHSERVTCTYYKSIKVMETDKRVLDTVLKIARDPALLEKIYVTQAKKIRQAVPESGLAQLRKELKGIEAEIGTTIEGQMRAIKAGIKSTAYETRLGDLERRREMVESELHTQESQLKRHTGPDAGAKVQAMAGILTGIEIALTSSDVALKDKHELLSLLIESITPTEAGKLEIVFR